jgi:hypothetical protein
VLRRCHKRACELERAPGYIRAEVRAALHRELGRKPWQCHVLDVDDDTVPPNQQYDMEGAAALLQLLNEACAS